MGGYTAAVTQPPPTVAACRLSSRLSMHIKPQQPSPHNPPEAAVAEAEAAVGDAAGPVEVDAPAGAEAGAPALSTTAGPMASTSATSARTAGTRTRHTWTPRPILTH